MPSFPDIKPDRKFDPIRDPIKKKNDAIQRKLDQINIAPGGQQQDIQIQQKQSEAKTETDIPIPDPVGPGDIQLGQQEQQITPIGQQEIIQPITPLREELAATRKSGFDIQRERVEAGSERERERREEALRRRLAQRGVTGGEAEKQIRLLMSDIERSKQQQLGDIRIAESELEERRADEERAREFEKELFGIKLGGEKELLGIKGQQILEQLGIKIQGQKDITQLQGDINKSLQELKNSFEVDRENRKVKSQRWFDLGVAGQEIPEDELRRMEREDPVAFNAYQAGRAGQSKDDYLRQLELEEEFRKAAITGLDPDDPAFQERLKLIYQELGIDIGLGDQGQGQQQGDLQQTIGAKTKIKEGGTLTPDEYQEVLNNLKNFGVTDMTDPKNYTRQAAGTLSWREDGNYWGLNRESSDWVDQNAGKVVKAPNGRLYQVHGKHMPKDTNDSWAIEYRDLETGEIVKISDPAGGRGAFRGWPGVPSPLTQGDDVNLNINPIWPF